MICLGFSMVACKKVIPRNNLESNTDKNTDTIAVEECKKCLVVSEQLKDRVAILDVNSGNLIWEWTPQKSNVPYEHWSWFRLIDEAKPVYNGKYLLITATNGGIAMVRVKDKRTVWYAHSDGKPHSAELLPDGNVVSANATGLTLTFFSVDSLKKGTQAKKNTYYLGEGHNVVWDKKRNVLWTTSHDKLKSFTYNNNCEDPNILAEVDNFNLPSSLPHDLFPVYGEDAFWLSTSNFPYRFDFSTKTFTRLTTPLQNKVKSISSGPADFPVVIIQGKEDYWTDEIKDFNGASVYQESNLKIYKARWLLPNEFSYTAAEAFKQCN